MPPLCRLGNVQQVQRLRAILQSLHNGLGHSAGLALGKLGRDLPAAGLPRQFTVIRYHSLAIERASLPECLHISATTEDGEIMGVRHTGSLTDPNFAPLEGVQFHPESILTEHGHAMLGNFLKM